LSSSAQEHLDMRKDIVGWIHCEPPLEKIVSALPCATGWGVLDTIEAFLKICTDD
jgi:hypothetical protein